jgi:hypothetical protein
MKAWVKQLIEEGCKHGIPFPTAREEPEGQPSFTLFTAWVSFVIAAVSVIDLHFHAERIGATLTAIFFWTLAMIFYRIRNLQKAKIDLSKKEVELDGDDDSPQKGSEPVHPSAAE